ncbi:MAG: hypothetical protein J4F40_09400 [Alphaproteobacteria bacterium]|nr:hypothetical protein [Alphaproteobacteria bacterium]MCY4497608.1 hypothetical protein [Rhodospirillaceae bacterium]
MELHLAVNLLMIAHCFTLKVTPANYRPRISPFSSMSTSRKLKFRIAEQRRDLAA